MISITNGSRNTHANCTFERIERKVESGERTPSNDRTSEKKKKDFGNSFGSMPPMLS
jgi:hypothetical protein